MIAAAGFLADDSRNDILMRLPHMRWRVAKKHFREAPPGASTMRCGPHARTHLPIKNIDTSRLHTDYLAVSKCQVRLPIASRNDATFPTFFPHHRSSRTRKLRRLIMLPLISSSGSAPAPAPLPMRRAGADYHDDIMPLLLGNAGAMLPRRHAGHHICLAAVASLAALRRASSICLHAFAIIAGRAAAATAAGTTQPRKRCRLFAA